MPVITLHCFSKRKTPLKPRESQVKAVGVFTALSAEKRFEGLRLRRYRHLFGALTSPVMTLIREEMAT